MNIVDTRANNTFNFVKRKNIKNIPLFNISFLDHSMDISGYTDVIFQSTPSVEFFNHHKDLRNKNVFAMGPGTQSCLSAKGISSRIPKNPGSEGLKKLVKGDIGPGKFLIVKGEGGLNIISDYLEAEGAEVDTVQNYQRVRFSSYSDLRKDFDKADFVIFPSRLAAEIYFQEKLGVEENYYVCYNMNNEWGNSYLEMKVVKPSIYRVSGCIDKGNRTTKCPTPGGNHLVIEGNNFLLGYSNPTLYFGGNYTRNITRLSSTKLTTVLPEGTGSNLEVYIQYRSKKNETLYDLSTNYFSQAKEGLKWFLFKKGKLSFSHLELGGFVKTSKEYTHPNIQYHFFPSLVINHGLTNPSFHGFQFHASPNRPKSRGFVKIRTSNVKDDPIIQFNYLKEEEDLIQMRESISIAEKIFSQSSFSSYLGEQLRPGNNCKSTEQLDEIIRNTADTAYHPSCTNKMGTDQMAVVDENTKVHGLKNLRIIDSSIMPDIVSGNLNAATLMIAEKASDIILNKYEEPIDANYYK